MAKSNDDLEIEKALAELDAIRQLVNETDGWDALDQADVDAFVNEFIHEPDVAQQHRENQ